MSDGGRDGSRTAPDRFGADRAVMPLPAETSPRWPRERLVAASDASADALRWARDALAVLRWVAAAWTAPAASRADGLQDAGRRSRGAGTGHPTSAAPQTGQQSTQTRRHGAGAGRSTSSGT